MLKRHAVCPCCHAPVRCVVRWSSKNKDDFTCKHCQAELKRVSTDKQPWTSVIIIVILLPSVTLGLFIPFLIRTGYWWAIFPLFVLSVVLMLVFNFIQFPYTNAFIKVVKNQPPEPNATHPPTCPSDFLTGTSQQP
ncbi:MAG: hypothetical protein ACF8OB_18315 [Phycisphaeraceae bacterium JB051]